MILYLASILMGWWAVFGCETPVIEDTGSIESAYERDLAPKLLVCAGCHGGDTPQGELDLTDIWSTVEVESKQAEMVLIREGNHYESYLWHKVAGTHSIAGGLGTRMPVGEEWSKEDIDLLALWIDLELPE